MDANVEPPASWMVLGHHLGGVTTSRGSCGVIPGGDDT